MKKLLIMTVTMFMLAVTMTSQAAPNNIKPFIGLWEGVDPEDGAHHVLSITDNYDRTVNLNLYASYWTTCSGDRGFAEGNFSLVAKKTLKGTLSITCYPTGGGILADDQFFLNSDGTLTEKRGVGRLSVIYHRTSKR